MRSSRKVELSGKLSKRNHELVTSSTVRGSWDKLSAYIVVNNALNRTEIVADVRLRNSAPPQICDSRQQHFRLKGILSYLYSYLLHRREVRRGTQSMVSYRRSHQNTTRAGCLAIPFGQSHKNSQTSAQGTVKQTIKFPFYIRYAAGSDALVGWKKVPTYLHDAWLAQVRTHREVHVQPASGRPAAFASPRHGSIHRPAKMCCACFHASCWWVLCSGSSLPPNLLFFKH